MGRSGVLKNRGGLLGACAGLPPRFLPKEREVKGKPKLPPSFLSKVFVGKIPEPIVHDETTLNFYAPCLEWRGATDQTGYGVYRAKPGTLGSKSGLVRAHRFAYFIRRKFPMNCQIDHLCRNRLCVRFSHLQLLGPKEHGRVSKKDQEKEK